MHGVVPKPLRALFDDLNRFRRLQVFAADSTPQYADVKNTLARTRLLVLSDLNSHQKQPAGGGATMREPDRIVRMKTVLFRTGLSRSTIYRNIRKGTFPPQIKISVNGAGWRESDINRWVADPLGWRAANDNDECGGKAGRHGAG